MSTTPHPGVSSLDYQSAQAQTKKRPNWVLRIGLTLAGIIGAVTVLLPSLCQSREPANRAKCQSNLHQIGLAILLYTQDHAGQYPDSFATLLSSEQLTPAVFVCPSTNDEAAEGDTPAGMLINFGKPRHCSYIYLGAGLTTGSVKDDTLIAYEPRENHQGDGMDMLFGDGHAEWKSLAEANQLIPQAPATNKP